ncbi:MAG TPA: hypothetical protein VHA35_19170 [Dongiaceae bacterium]|nr:hypothetical protein [Dongiaceae bacterium]
MALRHVYRSVLKLLDRLESDDFQDYIRRRAFPGRSANIPSVVIISMKKSGSIYLVRAMRNALGAPRVRFGGYGFTEPVVMSKGVKRLHAGCCVAQEHLPASPHVISALALAVPAINLHLRDPRRALVSWVGHLQDLLVEGRMVDALAFGEYVVPRDYVRWDLERRLEWHVDRVLPLLVTWIEEWLKVYDDPAAELKIVLTTLEELQRDPVACVQRILDALQVDIDVSKLDLPPLEVGRFNVRRDPAVDRKSLYPPLLWERATEMIPLDLRQRFDWS